MTHPTPHTLISVGQAAELLRLSPRAVLHRITKGELPATKIGSGRTSAYVLDAADVAAARPSRTAHQAPEVPPASGGTTVQPPSVPTVPQGGSSGPPAAPYPAGP